MVTYILLFVMLEAKQLQKVFQRQLLQFAISFLSALFALILFFARVLILFKVEIVLIHIFERKYLGYC